MSLNSYQHHVNCELLKSRNKKKKLYCSIMVFKILLFLYFVWFHEKSWIVRKRYKNDKKTYKLPSHIGLKFSLIFWYQIFLLDDFQEIEEYSFRQGEGFFAIFFPLFGPLCVCTLCGYGSCVSFISYEFFMKKTEDCILLVLYIFAEIFSGTFRGRS